MIIEGANRNAFLDKKELQDGEFLQILDEGWKEESKKYTNKDGSPKIRWMFNVSRMGETYTTEFNWTSIKELCTMYGAETADWAKKWVKLSKVFDPAKKMTMLYFLPLDADKNKELSDKVAKRAEKAASGSPLTPEDIKWEE